MLPTGCFWAVVDDGRDEAVEENADADKRRLAVTKAVSADAMEGMVTTRALWLACWCLSRCWRMLPPSGSLGSALGNGSGVGRPFAA